MPFCQLLDPNRYQHFVTRTFHEANNKNNKVLIENGSDIIYNITTYIYFSFNNNLLWLSVHLSIRTHRNREDASKAEKREEEEETIPADRINC